MSATILLADDHPLVRHGLRMLLEAEPQFSVVGETGDGLEVAPLVRRLRPDVLVLDLVLPGLGGLEVAGLVKRETPETRVVVFSVYADVAFVAKALQAGALAYVFKKSTPAELVRAMREVAAGRPYVSPPLSLEAVEQHQKAAGSTADLYDTLTRREREVLHLVADGLTSAEVAARLGISPRTVDMHRRHLVRKLGVTGQAALVRYAAQRDLYPPPP